MTIQVPNRRPPYRRWGAWLLMAAVASTVCTYVSMSRSLDQALQNQDYETAASLLKYGVHVAPSVLRSAINDGNALKVQWLLNHGLTVNSRSPEDSIPVLDRAISLDEPESTAIAKILLDHGADPNGTGMWGEPLIYSALTKPNTLELLLDHGARVDALYGTGETPIQMAALWGRASAIPVLAKHGADLNAPDLDGVTPLTLAHHVWSSRTPNDYKETYYALLTVGANPNAWSSDVFVTGVPQTWYGSPPLHNKLEGPPIQINGYGANFPVNWKRPNTPIKWWSVREQAGTFRATSSNPQGVIVSADASDNMTIKLPSSAKHWNYDVTICTEHERAIGSLNL